MRGPGVRLDLDVRRVWQCPACQRTRRLHGDLTAVHCQCPGEPWMQLVQERIPRLKLQNLLQDRELTVESFQLTEEELARPLPGRIRRRGPGPRPGEEPPGNNAGPETTANDRPTGRDRNTREPRPEAPQQPTAGESPNRSQPPRPPRGTKKPRPHDRPVPPTDLGQSPTESHPTDVDEFSAGLDLPDRPDEAV